MTSDEVDGKPAEGPWETRDEDKQRTLPGTAGSRAPHSATSRDATRSADGGSPGAGKKGKKKKKGKKSARPKTAPAGAGRPSRPERDITVGGIYREIVTQREMRKRAVVLTPKQLRASVTRLSKTAMEARLGAEGGEAYASTLPSKQLLTRLRAANGDAEVIRKEIDEAMVIARARKDAERAARRAMELIDAEPDVAAAAQQAALKAAEAAGLDITTSDRDENGLIRLPPEWGGQRRRLTRNEQEEMIERLTEVPPKKAPRRPVSGRLQYRPNPNTGKWEEVLVPLPQRTDEQQTQALRELAERCEEKRRKTEAKMEAKYLTPLTQTKKYAGAEGRAVMRERLERLYNGEAARDPSELRSELARKLRLAD
ncbi:unnamed protein product [Pedinophyceae sp. YPF-701]|nr:unnamed protein product [Pedinophyceae sp. YPF-701]